MKRTSQIGLSLLLVAAASLALSTGAFGSMAAERHSFVPVTGDESALVGYATQDQDVEGESEVALVEVTNKLDQDLTKITVEDLSLSNDDISIANVDEPNSITVGNSGTVTGIATCETPGATATVTVTIYVEAGGSSLFATIFGDTETRQFELSCPVSTSTGVRFTGASAGNAFIELGDAAPVDLEATYWLLEDGSLNSHAIIISDAQGSVNMKSETPGGHNGFAAVYIDQFDTTYVHPGLEYQNGDWSIPGGSGSNQVTDRECAGELDFDGDPPDAIACWSGT